MATRKRSAQQTRRKAKPSKTTQPKLPEIKLTEYLTPRQWAKLRELPKCVRVIDACENPCHQCPGHCCELLLTLTAQDVARISVTLGLHPREFSYFMDWNEAWRMPPVIVDGERKVLMLQSGDGKPCVFLHRIGTQRRCAIYGLRPMTCRLYPFRWWQNNNDLAGPRMIWCQQQWVLDSPTRRRLKQVILDSIVEENHSIAVFKAFARQRRHPATEEGFLHYVVEEGAKLLGLELGPLFEPPEERTLGKRIW